MRYQGKIINWKDEQGFGFVIPNGGGNKTFVHIKAFSSRSRRPVNGDIITYEQTRDKQQRLQASKIRFTDEPTRSASNSKPMSFSTLFTLLFCVSLIGIVFTGNLSIYVLGLYIVASIIAFIAYALDKSAALANRWRTKENTLHLLGLLGGWPGALLAQKSFRHKTKKESFQTVFWITIFINILALAWLLTKNGTKFLNAIISTFT